MQPAGQDDPPTGQQLSRCQPVPRPAGAASLVGRPGIEQDRVRPRIGIRHAVTPDFQRLDDRAAGAEAWRLRTVQLDGVQPYELSHLVDFSLRLVDEDAHQPRAPVQRLHGGPCLLGCDAAKAGAEMKADQIGAGFGGCPGRTGVADATDLDLRLPSPSGGRIQAGCDQTDSSRSLAAGSGERISASPTRMASAPARLMRAASSALWMPLSAT